MLPLVSATYRARAAGPASFAPSNNGNMQIAVPMTVTQGDHAGETITWISTFHDTVDKKGMNGEDRIIESLQFMGWKGDDLAELADVTDEQAQALMPEEVDIVCDVDTYEGNTRLKVKWVNRAGGGRFAFKEPLSGNNLKQFAAQMRGKIRGAQGSTRANSRPANGGTQPTHPNAPGSRRDDDIPF